MIVETAALIIAVAAFVVALRMKRGPQGEQGPMGPPGAMGPRGKDGEIVTVDSVTVDTIPFEPDPAVFSDNTFVDKEGL